MSAWIVSKTHIDAMVQAAIDAKLVDATIHMNEGA
jgi:hypothetical protein